MRRESSSVLLQDISSFQQMQLAPLHLTQMKARFTFMVLGSAAGEMGPPWAIIKCTCKGAGLSSTRVLNTIHLQAGFTREDGWTLRMWQSMSDVALDGRPTLSCKRPYLIRLETLAVITVQLIAWMDTPGICMWNEVQLHAWIARRTGRACLVWGTCGPHKLQL